MTTVTARKPDPTPRRATARAARVDMIRTYQLTTRNVRVLWLLQAFGR